MAAVGADRVRALIAEAGLRHTQIADSMRKMFCYLAGLAAGQDAGWPKVKDLVEHPPNPRPALNDVMTMASTAEDMVELVPRRRCASGYFKSPPCAGNSGASRRWRRRCRRSCRPASWPTARAAASTGRNFHCLSPAGPHGRGHDARHVLLHDQLDRPGQRRARPDEASTWRPSPACWRRRRRPSDRAGRQAHDCVGCVDPACRDRQQSRFEAISIPSSRPERRSGASGGTFSQR